MTLSTELCGCPTGCSGMEIINELRAHDFNYVSMVISNDREYEWMAYITFAYDLVYIRGNSFPISCEKSDFYNNNFFYPYAQLNEYTCLYNGSYANGFISLRELSASQSFTIYFDESRRRELCGWCGCNPKCVRVTWIVGGIFTALISLFLLFLLIKYRVQLTKICSKGTSIKVNKNS